MGLWQVLTGRSKAPRPQLDALFGIPSAAITLATSMDFTATGTGAVCYRKAEGPAFGDAERRLVELLDSDEGPDVERVDDGFGFTWLIVRTVPPDPGSLVTDLHAVNTSLEAEGFAGGLLCSVVGFADPAGRTLGLVYRYVAGNFYPFVPTGEQQRDSLVEMQVRTLLQPELPVEPELSKWMPLWGCPVLGAGQ
ncbi:MAG: PspA-associated protein PspAB [Marmoricola sp.]